jgi:hypothetical protein
LTTEAGGTDVFTVVLDSQPSANVVLKMDSSDPSEGLPSPDTLTFKPDNWDVPQTVTVTGQDDHAQDGPITYTILTEPATSADPNFDGVDPADVSATNSDNDTAGLTVSPQSGLITTEGHGTALIKVVLNTQPASKVTVDLSSSNTAEGVVSPASLTFTQSDWDVIQTVIATGVDDQVNDGDTPYQVELSTTSHDLEYDGLHPLIDATNLDAPTMNWVSPTKTGKIYVFDGDSPTIPLRINSAGDEDLEKVRFYRWDFVNDIHVDIGEDNEPPFILHLDPHSLYLNEYNQIFAVGYNQKGVASIHKYIWIFRQEYRLFLPTITVQK